MATPASTASVVVALCANGFVTVLKFVAFAASGSGAMLSEAIHSAADTGNQLLLFVGLKRAGRERDEDFHYGYGGERFVFGMLSAAGIFFIGSGVTVYHGISGLQAPHLPDFGTWTFIVLGIAFIVEGGALLFAVRAARQQAKGLPLRKYLRDKADPATLAVLMEDSAAVLGLVVASAGIGLAWATGNPVWDAAGSIVVGALLGFVALFLVVENREHLLGKAVPEGVEDTFIAILKSRPALKGFHDVKTRQLTPETFQFKAEIEISEDYLAQRLDAVLPSDPAALTGEQRARTLHLLALTAAHCIGDEIDAIELAVQATIPEAKHIDLEVDASAARLPRPR